VWWCTSVIPALRRQKQEDVEFEVILDYLVRICLKPSLPQINKIKTKKTSTVV
jgi:hypothetical protein